MTMEDYRHIGYHFIIQRALDISRALLFVQLTKDTPYLARKGEVWGVVREGKSDRSFIIVIDVLSALSYCI